jgi:DNA ligase-1
MFIVKDILKKLRETSSSKEKLRILTENKENKDLEKIFKYAYDKVDYVFNVSRKSVENYDSEMLTDLNLDEVLKILNERTLTGYKALELAKAYVNENPENSELFLEILDRDLKVGVNSKTLNKVWKGIIPRPKYCRCDVFSRKTANKIAFPAFIQLKCDGTYREAYVKDGKVLFKTRSGEDYSNPVLEEILKVLPDGYYTGEFTLGKADNPDANRAEGNGNINSDNPNFENIHFTIWDFLTEEEYAGITKTPYQIRFENLKFILDGLNSDLVHVVPCTLVNNIDEALEVVSDYMNKGLEGGVLKSLGMHFKDGTSKEQLKIKLKVDVEVRCTGFIEGTKGTKYEGKNKVVVFETDDGKIKGQCSGMTDAMVDEVTKNPQKYLNKVLSVQFNDLVKAEGHEYFALSHPVFMCFRDDKNETDTLEKALKLRDMAKTLK